MNAMNPSVLDGLNVEPVALSDASAVKAAAGNIELKTMSADQWDRATIGPREESGNDEVKTDRRHENYVKK